ncbi:hypothetical protein E4U53_000270 [Claviceps sorghi]|nr:hypothetical protein E4U53_000270 [Claviceps sorghi]
MFPNSVGRMIIDGVDLVRDERMLGGVAWTKPTLLPCRHFNENRPPPAEAFSGDLNNTLRNPVLLFGKTYDPVTPLRKARRLREEMGENARLIVHHGCGNTSVDTSACTDAVAKAYILDGEVPMSRRRRAMQTRKRTCKMTMEPLPGKHHRIAARFQL